MKWENTGLLFSILSAACAIVAGYSATMVAKRDKAEQAQEKSAENKDKLRLTVKKLENESSAFTGELANLNTPRKKDLMHQKIVKISELTFLELENPELKKDTIVFSKWKRLYDEMQQHIFVATGGYQSAPYNYQRVFDEVYDSWRRFIFEGRALRIGPNGDLGIVGE